MNEPECKVVNETPCHCFGDHMWVSRFAEEGAPVSHFKCQRCHLYLTAGEVMIWRELDSIFHLINAK